MGFHVCEYCPREPGLETRFKNTSSGDVNLTFKNGHKWVMPDMILHYVADHKWVPPVDFIEDVINGELDDCGRLQTRTMNMGKIYDAERVGYLSGYFGTGAVPEGFIEQLGQLMQKAGSMGNRAQTKGTTVWR